MLPKNLDKKYTNRKSELNFPKKANKEKGEKCTTHNWRFGATAAVLRGKGSAKLNVCRPQK